MKGIVLAGGRGTRLSPITTSVSKQLLPVFDKPLVYYPISTLMLAGIKEISIITTPQDQPLFQKLLKNGSQLGVSFTFLIQDEPKGIAEAFIIAENFIEDSNVALILGDNIFHGSGIGRNLTNFTSEDAARIMAFRVQNPEDFGVVEMDISNNPIRIIEKPKKFSGNLAIPGLYFYGSDVVKKAKRLKPSERGELEISSINQEYLDEGRLRVNILPRGTSWFDGGTAESLHEAGEYIRVIEKRQGLKIGCLEEISWRNGWIASDELRDLGLAIPGSEYGKYLVRLSEGEFN